MYDSLSKPLHNALLIVVASSVLTLTACDIGPITPGGGNQSPSANAGTDQNVEAGDRVELSALASTDANDDALTYLWEQRSGPNVTLDNANSAQASFVPVEDALYEFALTVTDGRGGSDTATVRVFVSSGTLAGTPLADAGTDRSINEGQSVTLSGLNSADPDGDVLTFEWLQIGGQEVSLSNPFVAEPSFIAPDVTGDVVLIFHLEVRDPDGLTSTTTIQITILDRDTRAVNDRDATLEGQLLNVANGLGFVRVVADEVADDGGRLLAVSTLADDELVFIMSDESFGIILRPRDQTGSAPAWEVLDRSGTLWFTLFEERVEFADGTSSLFEETAKPISLQVAGDCTEKKIKAIVAAAKIGKNLSECFATCRFSPTVATVVCYAGCLVKKSVGSIGSARTVIKYMQECVFATVEVTVTTATGSITQNLTPDDTLSIDAKPEPAEHLFIAWTTSNVAVAMDNPFSLSNTITVSPNTFGLKTNVVEAHYLKLPIIAEETLLTIPDTGPGEVSTNLTAEPSWFGSSLPVSYEWASSGDARFSDPNALDTTVTFSEVGEFLLALQINPLGYRGPIVFFTITVRGPGFDVTAKADPFLVDVVPDCGELNPVFVKFTGTWDTSKGFSADELMYTLTVTGPIQHDEPEKLRYGSRSLSTPWITTNGEWFLDVIAIPVDGTWPAGTKAVPAEYEVRVEFKLKSTAQLVGTGRTVIKVSGPEILVSDDDVVSSTREVILFARDFGIEDGDRVRVFGECEILEEDFLLTLNGSEVAFSLIEGENAIRIQALNQGDVGLNTAAFQVFEANGSQEPIFENEWNLTTGQIVEFTIIYEP